jgi:hypothetical protein
MNPAIYISILKEYLIKSINIFPIIIGSISFILYAGLGNIAFLFLFIGIALVVPAGVFCLQSILDYIFRLFKMTDDKWKKIEISKTGESTSIFTQTTGIPTNVVPSYWMTSVFFFGSYLFLNANKIYHLPPPKIQERVDPISAQADQTNKQIDERNNQLEMRYESRLSSAVIFMILSILIPFLLILFKMMNKTENGINFFLNFLFSGLLGIGLGTGLLEALQSCNSNTLTDIFGIAGQMRT